MGTDSENCARTRDLGYTTSKHIRMYGEEFELVSDPFSESGCTSVQVISGDPPIERTLRLPIAILLSQRFDPRKVAKTVAAIAPERI